MGGGGWWEGISNPPRFSSHPDVTRQSNNIEFSNTIFLQRRNFSFLYNSVSLVLNSDLLLHYAACQWQDAKQTLICRFIPQIQVFLQIGLTP